jgi:hypothetical protein
MEGLMSDIATVTRSLRTTRLYARLPRLAAALLVVVFAAAGVRAMFATRAKPAPARPAPVVAGDQGAAAFAEGFARAYLTWDAKHPEDRAARLKPYLGTLAGDGGLQPAKDSSQQVAWTSVIGERPERDVRLVTLAVQTTQSMVYLSVPVSRDRRAFLSVNAYPAIVGPPATDARASAPSEDTVDDGRLVDVVTRAMRNYLAGNRNNLLADLTPDALVSLPSDPLRVTSSSDRVTWVARPNRVAVQLDAEDAQKNSWALRYELDVRKRDRWYVRSVQVDPTFRSDS